MRVCLGTCRINAKWTISKWMQIIDATKLKLITTTARSAHRPIVRVRQYSRTLLRIVSRNRHPGHRGRTREPGLRPTGARIGHGGLSNIPCRQGRQTVSSVERRGRPRREGRRRRRRRTRRRPDAHQFCLVIRVEEDWRPHLVHRHRPAERPG